MCVFKPLYLFCCALNFVAFVSAAEDIQAVQLYTQDELLSLISKNEHLNQVVLDDCQLVQDIQASADVLKIPN